MNPAPDPKGNDPERWQKLLAALDEKLQFGLLEHLRRVRHFHFEGDALFLETQFPKDAAYLQKAQVLQQLELLAQDAAGVTKIEVRSVG